MADSFLSRVVKWMEKRRGAASSPRRPNDEDDGAGVPVPTGPRPRRGGAQARPPQEPVQK